MTLNLTSHQYIALTLQTLDALNEPTSEATAAGLLHLASVQAQLATARAIQELTASLSSARAHGGCPQNGPCVEEPTTGHTTVF